MYKSAKRVNSDDSEVKPEQIGADSIQKYLSLRTRKRVGKSFAKAQKKRYVAEERNYERIFMAGVTIFLPAGLRPYPTQKLMMVKMLAALRDKSNALIESPTGSGKTLALLSSACAWLVKYKEEREASKKTCPRHGIVKFAEDMDDTSNVPEVLPLDSKANNTNDDSSMITIDDEDDADIEEIVDEKKCRIKRIKSDDTICQNKSAFDELNEEFNEDFVTTTPSNKLWPNSNNNQLTTRSITPSTSNSNLTLKLQPTPPDDCQNVLSKAECTCYPRVTIYYGTRTHKQIAQVIKEYARLPFGANEQLRHTILASREHSCVNSFARSKGGDVTAQCKELLSNEGAGCTYRNEYRKFENNPLRIRNFVEESGGDRVWDMEDLVTTLSESHPAVCPYFSATRTLTIDADIVFCPFNYILDPIIRSSSDVHVKNSVIILDEAHNVEDICRDSASFEFHEKELTSCLENLSEKEKSLLDSLHNLSSSQAPNILDHMNNSTDGRHISPEEVTDTLAGYHQSLVIVLKFARVLYNWLKEWASETLTKTRQRPDGSFTLTSTWQQLVESLRNERDESKNLLLLDGSDAHKRLKTAWAMLASTGSSSSSSGPDAVLDDITAPYKPSSASIVCVEKFIYFLHFFSPKQNQTYYKCNVTIERSNPNNPNSFSATQRPHAHHHGTKLGMPARHATQYKSDDWMDAKKPLLQFQPIKPNFDVTLSLWCMFPSVAFADAFEECRSVILASGTLWPTETLKTELGLEFKSEMEGSQVISKEQIFATVLAEGPTGCKLNATYRNIASGSDFLAELARLVVSTCLTVPKGVLCFLSSYNVLSLLVEAINQSGLEMPLRARKVIFEEPRRSSDLQSTLDRYDEAIRNPDRYGTDCDGALMLAVFRGKVSEGIDFADDKARCVICVGIPYPNARNELVVQKKRFNDENSKTMNILGGDEWYTTQAYRALNQALGRCLRHRNDWGALILVDERFVAKANPRCQDSKKISRWVRDRLFIYSNFAKFEKALSDFVARMTPTDKRQNDENEAKFVVSKSKNVSVPLISIL